MENLGKLGLDPIHLVAQVVNFLIVGWIIYRFLLKPLLSTMSARREKIAQGLADAERARASLEEAARERQKILEQASAESFRILQNARDEAERLRTAALERAGQDAQRMVEEARTVMALERQDMERSVQNLSLRLSGQILEKVVSDLFAEDERTRIVARGIERIGAAARETLGDAAGPA